jgi:hypothetical protein
VKRREERPSDATTHNEFIALNGKRMAALATTALPANSGKTASRWARFVPLSHVERVPDSPPKQDALWLVAALTSER